MNKKEAAQIVDEIFSLYEHHGADDYIGEPVSQLEHMAQAAQLAEAEGYDDEVVLAAFFHDVGHLAEHVMPVQHMDGMGVVDHEKIGADFLRRYGFSERICALVESHVQAKRYLTYKFSEYYGRLSPASKITLSYQGGVMDADEAADFEASTLFHLIIKMREWDDKAKEKNKPLPVLDKFKALALNALSNTEFTVS